MHTRKVYVLVLLMILVTQFLFPKRLERLDIDKQIDFSFVEELGVSSFSRFLALRLSVWATCQMTRGSKSIRKPGDQERERLPLVKNYGLSLLLDSWFPYCMTMNKLFFLTLS